MSKSSGFGDGALGSSLNVPEVSITEEGNTR